MDLIITNPQWEEKGYLECDSVDIKMEIRTILRFS